MKKKIVILGLCLAFLVRFGVVFWGYHGDLNNNISWAKAAVERGFNGFYEGEVWEYSAPNQPPLTIIIFWFVRLVWQGVNDLSWFLNNNFGVFPSSFIWFWELKGMILLIKLPCILADFGIGWLIYKFVRKVFGAGEKLAYGMAFLWLFNPITMYNSSVWGQTDSVVNFLGLWAILFLLKKDLVRFGVLFGLSILFKGSLVIFIPILLFVAVKDKFGLANWVKAVGASALVVFVVSFWFHPSWDLPLWLVRLYNERILPGEIGYLTANAFNFWWLVDSGKVLDSSVYLGLPARVWGVVVTVGVNIGLIWWVNKKFGAKRILMSLVVVALSSFLFMTRIHERYMYPVFPLATVLLSVLPSFAVFYVILSLSYLTNMYHLFWVPNLKYVRDLFEMGLSNVLSLVNLAVLGVFGVKYKNE